MSPLSSMKRPTRAHARRVYADYRRRFPKAGKAQLELARENIFEFGHPDPLFGTAIPRRYRYKASARKMSRICGLTP